MKTPLPYIIYVNRTQADVIIRGKGTVIRIGGVCGNKNGIGRAATSVDDHGGVVKAFVVAEIKLYYVAVVDLPQGYDPALRTGTSVRYQEIVQLIYTRPRGRTVIGRYIIPPESGRVIHNLRTCEDALRRKIGAIPAQIGEIVKVGIPAKRPTVGVGNGGGSVVNHINHLVNTI